MGLTPGVIGVSMNVAFFRCSSSKCGKVALEFEFDEKSQLNVFDPCGVTGVAKADRPVGNESDLNIRRRFSFQNSKYLNFTLAIVVLRINVVK